MITGWPSELRIASLSARASVSTGPPAPNGTIRVTGRDGNGWAAATPKYANVHASVAVNTTKDALRMLPSLIANDRRHNFPTHP